MKTILLSLLMILSLTSISQVLEQGPIYKKGSMSISQSVHDGYKRVDGKSVRVPNSDTVYYFSYQNPEYTHIVDIKLFSVPKIDSMISIIDESIKVLDMEITKEQTIRHSVAGVPLVRYGFNKNVIYLNGDYLIDRNGLLKIREALINFNKN